MGIKDEVLKEIADFRKKHKMAKSVFGWHCMMNPSFIQRTSDPDAYITSITIDKVRAFIKGWKGKPES